MEEQIRIDLDNLQEAMQELENNSSVDDLIVAAPPEMTPSDMDANYKVALLNYIRTRKHLRKFGLFNEDNTDVDINPFLIAASENLGLQSLDLAGADGYTAETLGRFRSHPNLQQLHLSEPLDLNFEQDIMDVFGLIIETCPKMQHLKIYNSELSQSTLGAWRPVFEALFKTQRSLTLNLSWCYYDQAATNLLRSFLHDYPYPVHFLITVSSGQRNPPCLSDLIGPAVQKLCLQVMADKEIVQNFMESCQYREHLIYLEFQGVSLEEYQVIVDGIPHLSYVQELKIRCFYSSDRKSQLSNMKANLLRSLARNLSITNVDLDLFSLGISSVKKQENTWTELEYTMLQSLMRRNSTCSEVFASPDLIPLSLWPHVLRLVETTNAITSRSLIFQGLRGLSANLSAPYDCRV
jgi:hypothetical protein